MKQDKISAFLACVMLLAASDATAEEPATQTLVFKPTSAWNVDYAESHCALRRNFAAGENEALLELRQHGPRKDLKLILLVQGARYEGGKVDLRFPPHEELVEAGPTYGLSGRDGFSGIATEVSFEPETGGSLGAEEAQASSDLDPVSAWASDNTGIQFESGFGQSLALQTGPLAKPLEAMNQCIDHLLTELGIDPKAIEKGGQSATPIQQMNWARKANAQYPSQALIKGIEGVVSIRVIVGEDGRAESCLSLDELTPEILAEAACRATMKHARFKPALDEDGEPRKGLHLTKVTYALN